MMLYVKASFTISDHNVPFMDIISLYFIFILKFVPFLTSYI